MHLDSFAALNISNANSKPDLNENYIFIGYNDAIVVIYIQDT